MLAIFKEIKVRVLSPTAEVLTGQPHKGPSKAPLGSIVVTEDACIELPADRMPLLAVKGIVKIQLVIFHRRTQKNPVCTFKVYGCVAQRKNDPAVIRRLDIETGTHLFIR